VRRVRFLLSDDSASRTNGCYGRDRGCGKSWFGDNGGISKDKVHRRSCIIGALFLGTTANFLKLFGFSFRSTRGGSSILLICVLRSRTLVLDCGVTLDLSPGSGLRLGNGGTFTLVFLNIKCTLSGMLRSREMSKTGRPRATDVVEYVAQYERGYSGAPNNVLQHTLVEGSTPHITSSEGKVGKEYEASHGLAYYTAFGRTFLW